MAGGGAGNGLGARLYRLAVNLFFLLGALGCFWLGGSHLWALHSGVAARVDIVSCTSGKNMTCKGVWRPAGGTEETVFFPDGEGLHVGSTVDAHIRGGNAFVSTYPNMVFSVIIPLLLGCAALGVVIHSLIRPGR